MHKLNLNIIRNQPVALAISGGPDSMAMLYMMHEKGQKFTALTVNHNLRPEALEEAKYVASICQKLEIQHVILNWEHDGVTSNVHDRARDARYGLMLDWCNAHNIKTLCTAHHMDDRVEHFFIRVSRGAGLLGLIDHEEMLYQYGITLARPMFAFTKQELLDYLHEHKIKYYEDKSNLDTKYLRTNIRKWLDSMPAELDPELFRRRVIGVKDNLARAAKVVNRLFEEEMKKVEYRHPGLNPGSSSFTKKIDAESDWAPGQARGDGSCNDTTATATIHTLPIDEEIAIMMLSHILPSISGESDPPRMESMKRLYDTLIENNTSKTTLCGCIIEKKKGKIVISKEKGRE